MTVVDHPMQRLRLEPATLDALCLLATPTTTPAAAESAWQAVTAAGVVSERRLPGWIAELAEVAAAPGLRLVVEVAATDAPVVHQLWSTPRRTVVGSPADERGVELRGLETVMLPLELARIVGLGPRPTPTQSAAITVAATTLAAAVQAVETQGRDHAHEVLVERGSPTHVADLVADICASRRLTWRVTSIWRPRPESQATGDLTVVDAGDAGLWLSEPDNLHDPDTMVTLTPTRPSAVWRRLLGLLPTTPKPPVHA